MNNAQVSSIIQLWSLKTSQVLHIFLQGNGNSIRKSSSVDMLATESGSDAEKAAVANADLKLPKLPSRARDSFFEHILIEYNRSPRHGWETTDMDSETDELSDEQRVVQQRNIGNNSSDGEIETEVL